MVRQPNDTESAEDRLLQIDGQRHAEQGEWGNAQVRIEAALVMFRPSGALADARRVEQALWKPTTREQAKPDSILPLGGWMQQS